MAEPKRGTEYVCEVCGTTLVVTEEGVGILEDIVCCEKPMRTKATKPRKTAGKKAKKAAKKRSYKKK